MVSFKAQLGTPSNEYSRQGSGGSLELNQELITDMDTPCLFLYGDTTQNRIFLRTRRPATTSAGEKPWTPK